MASYRKKPVVIEAIRWTGEPGNLLEITQFVGSSSRSVQKAGKTLQIPTLEGVMTANLGDWIILGVQGEPYPCKPDIFELTYEEIT